MTLNAGWFARIETLATLEEGFSPDRFDAAMMAFGTGARVAGWTPGQSRIAIEGEAIRKPDKSSAI